MPELNLLQREQGGSRVYQVAARGDKPWIAEITGRDSTYRYARQFRGNRTLSDEVVMRVYPLPRPALLEIKAEQRAFYVLYLSETFGALHPIDEATLNRLLDSKAAYEEQEREKRVALQQAELQRAREEWSRTRAARSDEMTAEQRSRMQGVAGDNPIFRAALGQYQGTSVYSPQEYGQRVQADWSAFPPEMRQMLGVPEPERPQQRREAKKPKIAPLKEPARRKISFDD